MMTKQRWFLVAILGMLILAPNAMLMRYTLYTWDPFFFNFVRSGIAVLIMLPLVLRHLSSFRGVALKSIIIIVASLTVAATAKVLALKFGPASYVGIISLVSPIMLVWYASRLANERITPRAMAGITLAAIGAMVVVLLPYALSQQHGFIFYPLATAFALVSCFMVPLATVETKVANQRQGVPLFAIIGVSNISVMLVSLVLWITAEHGNVPEMHTGPVIAMLYSAIGAIIVSRALIIWSYERIGVAVNSALSYAGTLLGVVLPVIFLHEKLSVEMVVGGILILFGVYVTEHHKSSHHKHHHALNV